LLPVRGSGFGLLLRLFPFVYQFLEPVRYPANVVLRQIDSFHLGRVVARQRGMEAFRAVLDGLHQRGMKLIMDLVVNHTSDEHEWFQKSRRRIEPYTDYYIWRPAKKNGKLPNNWDSHFEGKAWQWDDLRQEYYLHLFAVKQPDLNMDNPLVRTEVKKILKFWLDLGVDGFREDVITFISKKEGLPDDHLFPVFKGIRFYNHGPHIHEYLQEFRRDVLANYDCMTIAEAPLVTPQRALDYIAESDTNEIDMMIQFQCMCADCFFTDYMPRKFSLNRLRRACDDWKKETNIGFALYGTPAESLCYRFARIDKERFGTIPDVTDKGYYTNSYHVDVREHIDAFEKFTFESQFQKISTGGGISYCGIPHTRPTRPGSKAATTTR